MRLTSEAYRAVSGGAAERSDCFPRSLALACNMPYPVALRLCAELGRKPNRSMPITRGNTLLARLDLQFAAGDTHLEAIGRRHYDTPADRPTVAQWLRQHPQGRYVVGSRGHAFAVIDGVVHDWYQGRSEGMRRRVCRYWCVPPAILTHRWE